MINPNPKCPNADCKFEELGCTSTLVAWNPTYDKHGNYNCNDDPNTYTTRIVCHTCGKDWEIKSQHGKSEIKEIP